MHKRVLNGGDCLDVQLKKGVLEAAVLASLSKHESYGYKIISDLSPYIEISESTLYPILRRLEEMGCLTTKSREHNGRLRKYYQITVKGKQRLREFVYDIREIQVVYDYIIKEGL
jgi:PadR family transcriptional regulator PadR